jgi:hypothetical protein
MRWRGSVRLKAAMISRSRLRAFWSTRGSFIAAARRRSLTCPSPVIGQKPWSVMARRRIGRNYRMDPIAIAESLAPNTGLPR